MKTEMVNVKKGREAFVFPCLLYSTDDTYDDIVILATKKTQNKDNTTITGAVVHINPQSKQNMYSLGVAYDFDSDELELYKGIIQLSN